MKLIADTGVIYNRLSLILCAVCARCNLSTERDLWFCINAGTYNKRKPADDADQKTKPTVSLIIDVKKEDAEYFFRHLIEMLNDSNFYYDEIYSKEVESSFIGSIRPSLSGNVTPAVRKTFIVWPRVLVKTDTGGADVH